MAVTGVTGGSAPVVAGGFTYTEFTASGTATIVGSGNIEVVVQAGGGGGGAGGGGGGGLVYNSAFAVTNGQTLTVTIGAGGAGTANVDCRRHAAAGGGR